MSANDMPNSLIMNPMPENSTVVNQTEDVDEQHIYENVTPRCIKNPPFIVRQSSTTTRQRPYSLLDCNLSNKNQMKEKLKQGITSLVLDDMTILPSSSPNVYYTNIISGPKENRLVHFEKRDFVDCLVLVQGNEIVNKKWSSIYLLLSGPTLFVYKQVKATLKKAKQSHGKLLFSFDLKDICLEEPTELETTKPFVLKVVHNKDGVKDVLLFHFVERVYLTWKSALPFAQSLVNDDRMRFERHKLNQPGRLDVSFLDKFKALFTSRSSIAALKARGILKKESIFGFNLIQICEAEMNYVPNFVVCVIRAVEAKGLDYVGIYRLSAGVGSLQKFRAAVDQNNCNFNSETWTIEVLTCSLKQFFRELREPLFTFKAFRQLLKLLTDETLTEEAKLALAIESIRSMPIIHYETARTLFHHLYRVIGMSELNQMTPSALANVLGPSLMWPEGNRDEMSTLSFSQIPCLLYILTHVVELYGPICPPPVVL